MNNQNIILYLKNAAEKYPNKVAIHGKKQSVTYAQLWTDVQQTAAHFQKKGLQAGDRVLVFVPVSIDLYRSVMALFYIGATAVFLDEWSTMKRLRICCKLADCKGFIGITKALILAFFIKELKAIPIKLGVKFSKTTSFPSIFEATSADSALITFTTGSTGTPKAADRTHEFLHEQFESVGYTVNAKPSDISMPVLPILTFINLANGATSVLPNFNTRRASSLHPKKLIAQLNKYQVSQIISSPYVIKHLAQYLEKFPTPIPSLTHIYTGGAPVFPDEAQDYTAQLKNVKSTIVFGSTEAEPISEIDAKEVAKADLLKLGGLPVGKIYPKATIKIITIKEGPVEVKDWKNWVLPQGEVGEIVVAGHHVLKRYFNNPQAFKENKIVYGRTIWHRTGDAGFIGDNGELYLVGRCKQLITYKNGYISPFLTESILASIPQVHRGTVMEYGGNIIVCIELLAHNLPDKEVIKSTILDALPFEIANIRFFKKIPMDPRHQSKIDYGRLRENIIL